MIAAPFGSPSSRTDRRASRLLAWPRLYSASQVRRARCLPPGSFWLEWVARGRRQRTGNLPSQLFAAQGHGAIGAYAFEQLPRIGDTITMRPLRGQRRLGNNWEGAIALSRGASYNTEFRTVLRAALSTNLMPRGLYYRSVLGIGPGSTLLMATNPRSDGRREPGWRQLWAMAVHRSYRGHPHPIFTRILGKRAAPPCGR